jgi:sugar lactone lactonase YvrE
MAITAASPAYDATTDCGETDQRGVSQLQRGAQQCDIGAYQVSAPTTYVANRSPASVTAYATGANGNAAPILTLSGPATGLQQASGLVTDTNGDVFVTDPVANAITEFAPEANGNVAPIARIAGTATKLTKPADLAIDGSGRLYVTNDGGSPTITEYAPGANGNVAPVTSISGPATRLSNPAGIVIGPDGNLHVANDNATVTTFALRASGNAAPLSVVRSSALAAPRGLNFDPSGQLIVASSLKGTAVTFAAAATGTAQPTGTRSGLGTPIGLDLDLPGNLFVADNKSNRLLEYPLGQQTPSATITGSQTGLSAPAFLSELPPTPAPHLRASAPRRQTRTRLITHGIAVRIRAFKGLAFRDRPVTVTATARIKHTTIATARATSVRPGATTVRLRPTPKTAVALGRHRRTLITVTVTAHDPGGTQRHTVRIVSTG